MKNLSEIVTNLELSKKLKSLGVEQEGLFYWNDYRVDHNRRDKRLVTEKDIDFGDYYRAFTASELWELLPQEDIIITKFNNDTKVEYDIRDGFLAVDKTMPDSMARCLIYLIENNYINLEGENGNKTIKTL